MIPYRPITPLTVGPGKGWRPVLAAVVLSALLGTTAITALAAERDAHQSSIGAVSVGEQGLPATEPARREP